MTMTASYVAGLLTKLGDGWPATSCPPVDELLSVWKERVAPFELLWQKESSVAFRTSLPNSRLRGTAGVCCLLVGGNTAEAALTVELFVREHAAPGRLLFFFCVNEAVLNAVRAEVRLDRALLWPPEQVVVTWSSERMVEQTRAFVTSQLPLRTLTPYDITVSAAGPMFYGRESELGRIAEEDGQCFAITGPGRIGKTSMVKRLQEKLLLKRDPARHSTFYIDFFESADRRPDVLARKIAMEMEPGRRADRTTADDLSGFIEYQQSRLKRRPTLILDEVDEVCSGSLFREQLATSARHEHCRFILVGRGGLLRFTKENSRPLASRLRVLRLGAIDPDSARRLLHEPIRELGMEFESFERIFELVRRQTGCSPHMLQFYGQRLVEIATEQSTRRILVQHLEQLRWDHSTATFFLSPLDDLRDEPLTRAVALCLLKAHRDLSVFTPATIQDVSRTHGIPIEHSDAVEVGDTLVIQNILAWADGGGYRIANEALPEYAGKMGYLTRGLDDARKALTRRTAGAC